MGARVASAVAAAAAALMLTMPAAQAQSQAQDAGTPASRTGQTSALRIVLMRHGVRSPTKSPEALAPFATEPWARWPVAPGQLTPHGIAAMKALGSWWRNELGLDRLAARCPASAVAGAPLLVISDSTPRNHASAKALMEGLLPGCPEAGHFGLPAGQHDPLFQGSAGADEDTSADAVKRRDGIPKDGLDELQAVLIGGAREADRQAARASGHQLLVDQADPRKPMGTLAENLMLEYVEGLPAPAWGRLDESGIGRIVELHNAAFAQQWKDDPVAARRRASDLLARISAALRAGNARPLAGDAQGAGGGTVFLVGHDTNLAAVAGLLGLDWHDPARPDDYPPGGALVFDLGAGAAGAEVRLGIAMPTLGALRRGRFDAPGDMAVKPVAVPGCGGASACPLGRFADLVDQVIDTAAVPAAEPVRPFVR